MKNMKIKIIHNVSSAKSLENEVNEFLKTHDVIDIQYQPVLILSANPFYDISDRVMIVYEDDQ